MKKSEYDTIVVGAGPAGLRCAIRLAEGGGDVLVVEKAVFPRDKCCAGYVTGATMREYEKAGLDFENCPYFLIDDFNIYSKLQKKQTIKNIFLFTSEKINRVDLDNAFFLSALARGIEIAENTRAVGLSDGVLTVSGDGGEHDIKFRNLVFADGASGFSSRFFENRRRNIAMQMIFESDVEDKIDIHFGITKHGYGWVSSYRGRVNVGLTDVWDAGINYKEVFADYLKKLGLDADVSGLKAAFTPIGVKVPRKFRRGGVFFVGDALGACDPMTLSGLRYGLRSGTAAAEAILASNRAVYKKCVFSLKARFAFTRFLQRVFYLRPVSSLVFNVGCRFLGGVISFAFNHFFVNKK